MNKDQTRKWLEWAREIQSLGQIGHYFSENEHEKHNYHRLQEIAAEMLDYRTEWESDELSRVYEAQPGYATAKIDVRGAAVSEGKILLVQEARDGLWCLPGGWADVGEKPSDMVIREVKEESGFDVRPYKIAGVYDANRTGERLELFHAYKIVFLCSIIGGQAKSSIETLDVDFYSFQDLPVLSSPRTDQRHLLEIEEHLRDPDRPAAFD